MERPGIGYSRLENIVSAPHTQSEVGIGEVMVKVLGEPQGDGSGRGDDCIPTETCGALRFGFRDHSPDPDPDLRNVGGVREGASSMSSQVAIDSVLAFKRTITQSPCLASLCQGTISPTQFVEIQRLMKLENGTSSITRAFSALEYRYNFSWAERKMPDADVALLGGVGPRWLSHW